MEDDETVPELMLEDTIEAEVQIKEAEKRIQGLEESIKTRWEEIEREKMELEELLGLASSLAADQPELCASVAKLTQELRLKNEEAIKHAVELERATNEKIKEVVLRTAPLVETWTKEKELFVAERSRQEAAVFQIDLDKESSIDFCSKGLSKFPAWVLEAKKLTSLNISNNQFALLPDNFGDKLPDLSVLSLAQNQLRDLPRSFSRLSCLQTLDLGGNMLSNLAEHVGEMKSLMRLDLYNNSLRQLPPNFVNLVNLTELNICNNKLTHLPEDIEGLSSLVNLHLSSNELVSLPPSLSRLSHLAELRLNGNNLRIFPCVVFALPSLRKLDLSFNEISDPVLSEETLRHLENVKQLEFINLENNRLRDLDWLMRLNSSVLLLNVKNNGISRLDEGLFEKHQQMQHLDVQNNKLTTLPVSIKTLVAIEFLNIQANPFSDDHLRRISGLSNKSTCAQQVKKMSW